MVTCMMEKGSTFIRHPLNWSWIIQLLLQLTETISAAPQAEGIQLQEVTAQLKQFAG